MQIFDTHCHYNLAPIFAGDPAWKAQWQTAQDNGVVGSIIIGTNRHDCETALNIAQQDRRFGAAIGIHPAEYNQVTLDAIQRTTNLRDAVETALLRVEEDAAFLSSLLKNPKVVAVGETGLDFFHFADASIAQQEAIKEIQRAALRRHLLLSGGTLPVILHVRDRSEEAYWNILEILKHEQFTGQFILHCASGPLAYIDSAVQMGGYVSIAGNVTYKSAEHIREIVRRVPKDRLLIETDAPFLPPVPHRGESCEPWMIRHTAEYLVNELGIDPDQLLANTYRLFPTLHSPS
jgi:TatD DNase family protein